MTYRYPLRAMAPDYARAAGGFLCTATPALGDGRIYLRGREACGSFRTEWADRAQPRLHYRR